MAKIVRYNDDFNVFSELLEKRIRDKDYEGALMLLLKKLDKVNSPMFRELLLHRLTALYVTVDALGESLAVMSELTATHGAAEYTLPIKLIYDDMCGSIGYPAKRQMIGYVNEYNILSDAVTVDGYALWNKYSEGAVSVSTDRLERISITTRNDVRRARKAYEEYAAGDYDKAILYLEEIKGDSEIIEPALELKAFAALGGEDYALALDTAEELYRCSNSNRSVPELMLIANAHLNDELKYHEIVDKLYKNYSRASDGILLSLLAEALVYVDKNEDAYRIAKSAYEANPMHYGAIAIYALSALLTGRADEVAATLERGSMLFPRCNCLRLIKEVLALETEEDKVRLIRDSYFGFSVELGEVLVATLPTCAADENALTKLRKSVEMIIDSESFECARYACRSAIAHTNIDISDIFVSGLGSPYLGLHTKRLLLEAFLEIYPEKSLNMLGCCDSHIMAINVTGYRFKPEHNRSAVREIYAEVSRNLIMDLCVEGVNIMVAEELDNNPLLDLPAPDYRMIAALTHCRVLGDKLAKFGERVDIEDVAETYGVEVAELREICDKRHVSE